MEMTAGQRIKTSKILDWVDVMNTHWDRLEGILENDKHFWNDACHKKTKSHWVDFVEISRLFQALDLRAKFD